MAIYISDKSRKEECVTFRKFWEEEWFPEIKRSLYDFYKETDGQIVADLREKPAKFQLVRTQADMLPTFMKLAKNRERIVKLLKHMQER